MAKVKPEEVVKPVVKKGIAELDVVTHPSGGDVGAPWDQVLAVQAKLNEVIRKVNG